jgi:hypothetical protein
MNDVLPGNVERPTLPERQEDARRTIAFALISVYLVLLVANIAVPIVLYLNSHPKTSMSLADLKDMTLVMSAALANLVGILGFVVGFYFKAMEEKAPGVRSKRRHK